MAQNVRSFSRTGNLDEAFNVRIAKAEIMLITKNPELRSLRVVTGRQEQKKETRFSYLPLYIAPSDRRCTAAEVLRLTQFITHSTTKEVRVKQTSV